MIPRELENKRGWVSARVVWKGSVDGSYSTRECGRGHDPDHFDESQYESHRVDNNRRLKAFAVPTIFPFTIPSQLSANPVPINGTSNDTCNASSAPTLPLADHSYCIPNGDEGTKEIPVEELDSENDGGQEKEDEAPQPDFRDEASRSVIHVVSKCPANDENNPKEKVNKLKQALAKERKERCVLEESKSVQEAAFAELFNKDQLERLCRRSRRGVKWSAETIQKGLQLLSVCGSAGYELLLSQKQPLPSMRSLRRQYEKTNYPPLTPMLVDHAHHDSSSDDDATQKAAPIDNDERDTDDHDEDQQPCSTDEASYIVSGCFGQDESYVTKGEIKKLKRALAKERREKRMLEKRLGVQKAVFAELFTKDQLESISCNSSHSVKWTAETIKKGLQLWSVCGEAGYELLLSQKQPLPSISTLRRQRKESNSKDK
ncbi:uncharacterized protein LOC123516349 isoform X2 [Portunus trituberculatus]|uniref:Uncharacterized protein n=1 Tax=Portunus trituberculatus TaxID=210409 RepID=A0A5B7FT34_PORTR|nr:uncharacterized protein LOC123516349 isoform X2 [Portunus trituberculatus]XP_045131561.1 uncharacterized protein LOC123516349 isoform X2 [Portunus trituberculatus]XP_045131562.1 uncharacterized protein LOC123516349 isoform X2 [Portunus trituberculatus]XP_045131563.1 uncharacterized protein LOC123516349 isoform X2 [Portunus trituberculatus]MPC48128.1 hypothetical protein [Portunus trituberculatus]